MGSAAAVEASTALGSIEAKPGFLQGLPCSAVCRDTVSSHNNKNEVKMSILLPLFLWLFTTGCFPVEARFEPYEVLGVHRRANNQDIKKAYKAKIRQWHPDLNLDPESQAKFIELNTAYELLSDPDRRRSYDNHGITEDSPNFRKVRKGFISVKVLTSKGERQS